LTKPRQCKYVFKHMRAKADHTVELLVDVGKNILNFKKLIDLNNSPGWIVSDKQIEEWYFSGFKSRNNKFYLYGPLADGMSLANLLTLPAEKALDLLIRLTSACQRLIDHTTTQFSLQLDSVYFLKDGSILILPPEIVKKVREFNPENYRFDVFSRLNNPYLFDHRLKLSYSLGCLLYHLAAGDFPFQGADESEVNSKIRAYSLASPILSCPTLKAELVEFFQTFFSEKLNFNISLSDWENILKQYRDKGLTRKISAREKAEVLSQAQEKADKNQKRFQFHLFMEKQGRTILLSLIIGIAASIVLFTYISNFFKPRLTKGFTPRQVVEAFYQSMNELNPSLMEDCVSGEAGRPELSEVRNLFVTVHQQLGLGVKRYISAREWDMLGKPIIALGQFVYGITNLELSQEEYGEKPVFLAVFQKWEFTELPENYSEVTIYPSGRTLSERLYLKQEGEDWIIFKRDRLKEEPLPPK
jgi:serine/threonine protein kinase